MEWNTMETSTGTHTCMHTSLRPDILEVVRVGELRVQAEDEVEGLDELALAPHAFAPLGREGDV